MQHGATSHPHWETGPQTQWEQRRETWRAVRGTSCSKAIIHLLLNRCFQTLIWMSVSAVSHTGSKSNIHCTRALLLVFPSAVHHNRIQYFPIPKVCVLVWPAVHSFPENRINKKTTQQAANPQGGSRIYKYLICPAEPERRGSADHTDSGGMKWSPDVTHLPIDHINVWIACGTALNGRVYRFLISVKQMRKNSHEPPRLCWWFVTSILYVRLWKFRLGPLL